MPFIVVYDTDALYPNTQRDLLLRIALAKVFVQAKWTDKIIEELAQALTRRFANLTAEKTARLCNLINDSVPDCLVTGYEPLIDGLKLPDPDDRHVLAAAIKAGAQAIGTANVRDYPPEYLQQWDIEAKTPDAFVLDQIHINDKVVFACVQQIADSRRKNPVTVQDVLTQLERSGLVQSVAALRAS